MTAVAVVAAAVTGMTRFASASLVNVAAPGAVGARRGHPPRRARTCCGSSPPRTPGTTIAPRPPGTATIPGSAIADASTACLVIAVTSCTNVRNARTYVKFDLSSLPAGATIESATIQMVGGPTTISSTPVTARRVTSSWSESTMTYNSRPSTSSSGVVTGASVASGGTEVLTLDVTAMVAARGTATIANGWELRPNGTNDSWWYSSEWGTAAQRPTLTVVYR